MKKWRLFGLIVLLMVVFMLFGTRPFLAVNDPINSDVLVVEGWIDPANLNAVAEIVEQGHYKQVITTGTYRSFAYYLKGGEGIELEATAPVEHHVAIEAAGVNGAVLWMMNERSDTLLKMQVSEDVRTFHATLKEPTASLRFSAHHPLASGDTTDVVFIRQVLLGNIPAHAMANVALVDRNGNKRPGSRTHADIAVERLVELGVPKEILHPAAAEIGEGGRTKSNAIAAAEFVKDHAITSVDVVSEGVHARRSWGNYKDAMGEHVKVGIISLPDLDCPSSTSWTSMLCWMKIVKEMGGLMGVRSSSFEAEHL